MNEMYRVELKFDSDNLTPSDMDRICEQTDQIFWGTKWMDSAQRKGINFEIPWLNYCVSVCTISDVPELFDISYVFEREAQQLLKKQV